MIPAARVQGLIRAAPPHPETLTMHQALLLLAQSLTQHLAAEVVYTEAGMTYRARWLGGGRLVVLGFPGRTPTDAELADEDPTDLSELDAALREVFDHALLQRAWLIASGRAIPKPPPARRVVWCAVPVPAVA